MDERIVREQLAAVADSVGPMTLVASAVISKVRRRWTMMALVAGVAAAMLVGGVVTANHILDGDGASVDPAEPAVIDPRAYQCGRRLDVPAAMAEFDGVTLTIAAVHKLSTTTAPRISIALSSPRAVNVVMAPLTDVQILILRDGVIVGGGPTLAEPAVPPSPELRDLIGHDVNLAANAPVTQDLQPYRQTLCAGEQWEQIWSDVAAVDVVVAMPRPAVHPPLPQPPGRERGGIVATIRSLDR